MLLASNNSVSATASTCIYCTFRLRQAFLKSQRSRTSTRAVHIRKLAGWHEYEPKQTGVLQSLLKDDASSQYERSEGRRRQGGREDSKPFDRSSFMRGGRDGARPAGNRPSFLKKGFGLVSKLIGEEKSAMRDGTPEVGGLRTKEMRKRARGLADFDTLLRQELDNVKKHVQKTAVVRSMAQELGQTKEDTFEYAWQRLSATIQASRAEHKKPFGGKGSLNIGRIYQECMQGYASKGTGAVRSRLQFAFFDILLGQRYQAQDIAQQKAIADLRYPTELFPKARQMSRTFHLHVGPTNSGKTYQALKRLETAKSGAYAGPLRLLAHEVYNRMNAKGIATMLVTGEEMRDAQVPARDTEEKYNLMACTVEMLPTNMHMEVCVIDEVQMLAHEERGSAWTDAIMGVEADEIHLCGEARAVPLMESICASLGEKLFVHRYNRLSPLRMSESSLNGNLKLVQKGDCIISFSVMGIHALRRQIEQLTGKKVAIVYGSLPPETRNQQAQLFNDPDNDYDYLVASDAIGMGLNLAIKRVIFESVFRFNGERLVTLDTASIKQIAGRAGRYRTARDAAQDAVSDQPVSNAKGDPQPAATTKQEQSVGLVTTLEKEDFEIVAAALAEEPPPLESAGIDPPLSIMEQLSAYYPPETPFSYLILKAKELCSVNRRFHLCSVKDKLDVADMVDDIKGLELVDRFIFLNTPTGHSRDRSLWLKLIPRYAQAIADRSEGGFLDIKEIPLEVLDLEPAGTREYLEKLESVHSSVVSYLWLSYRFPSVFTSRPLAFHVKQIVEEKIASTLSAMSFVDRRQQLKLMRATKRKHDFDMPLDGQRLDVPETQGDELHLASQTDEDDLGLEEGGEVKDIELDKDGQDTPFADMFEKGTFDEHHELLTPAEDTSESDARNSSDLLERRTVEDDDDDDDIVVPPTISKYQV